MARGPRKQAFETNVVKKNDNTQTLLAQRTDARLELGRVIQWVETHKVSVEGVTLIDRGELITKLTYLRDKSLREDV